MINFKTVKKYRKHEKIKKPSQFIQYSFTTFILQNEDRKRYKELRAKKILLAAASGIPLPMRDAHTQMRAHTDALTRTENKDTNQRTHLL